jgi:transcriptional regulator with XRE-family HTH domain
METISLITFQTRNDLNLSQEEFGRQLGVTKQTVSLWEKGKRIPDILYLDDLHKNTSDWRREWARKCLYAHPRRVVI